MKPLAKTAKRTPAKQALIPFSKSLKELAREAKDCKNCDLWRAATQTVFGEGSPHAQSKPFVGPAGKLLDASLLEAGIDRKKVYVTNAVKHFKWEPRGKRRIHKKPSAGEIAACRPWLDAEIAVLKPKVIVCLGATAAQALLGSAFRVTERHGEFVDSPLASYVMATVHPSSILRARDEKTRHEEEKKFVEDLKRIRNL